MKKIIVPMFLTFCLLVVAVPGYTYPDDYKTNLKEGFDIIAKSPKPLIDSVKDEYNASEFKPFGVLGGFFKGSFYSLGELSHGLYRVITFNVWEDNIVTRVLNNEGESK